MGSCGSCGGLLLRRSLRLAEQCGCFRSDSKPPKRGWTARSPSVSPVLCRLRQVALLSRRGDPIFEGYSYLRYAPGLCEVLLAVTSHAYAQWAPDAPCKSQTLSPQQCGQKSKGFNSSNALLVCQAYLVSSQRLAFNKNRASGTDIVVLFS